MRFKKVDNLQKNLFFKTDNQSFCKCDDQMYKNAKIATHKQCLAAFIILTFVCGNLGIFCYCSAHESFHCERPAGIHETSNCEIEDHHPDVFHSQLFLHSEQKLLAVPIFVLPIEILAYGACTACDHVIYPSYVFDPQKPSVLAPLQI